MEQATEAAPPAPAATEAAPPAPAKVAPPVDPKTINPFTGKKRTISNGTELGDMTEHFHSVHTREEKRDLLKKYPALHRYFPPDRYADPE